MTIKLKLILLTAIPLLAVLVLGVQGFTRSTRVVNEMQDVQSLTGLAVNISAVVHETQKERGRTAGFLGSGGTTFQAELTGQRGQTALKVAELQNYLDTFDADMFGQVFSAELSAALADLDRLGDQREKISALSISTPEAIGYYTQMNAKFLNLINAMSGFSTDADITVATLSYASFLKCKERAGIERAVLSNTFAGDKFGPGMYRKFIALVTEQDAYAREFLLCADVDAQAVYDKATRHPSIGQVQAYREIAFEKYATGGFGVAAGEWFDTITQKINQLKRVDDALAASLTGKAGRVLADASHARTVFAGITLGIIAVMLTGAYLVMRSITVPIGLIVESLKDIAEGEGDLTQRVNADRKDEIGELGRWFNAFIEKVQAIIVEVKDTTHEVASASTQIASQSEELACGMEEQKQQISQISAAIEQMSCSVVEVAHKSGEAANNAREAGRVAQEGGHVVTETIGGMQSISEAVTASAASVSDLGKRGEQIGQIIEVINDIADQTNLLALNAAIEAARAGEHGRGFAVVADEVRKLADRTTKATDEIAGSITAIQTETTQAVERMNAGTEYVTQGVHKATEAGQSLEKIVTSTETGAEMIQSIAAAAEQQSSASQMVAENVRRMSAVTSESREATSQTASAVVQLSQKAENLQALVGRFKVA